MAWFISNKIGRDDAAKYYRRLFRGERGPDGQEPPDYVKEFREHFAPPEIGFPLNCLPTQDNWKVGKAWFLAAESRIDPPRYPVRGMANVIFYSDAPTCQFYYADNLEKDGVFGQVARRAWHDAEEEWHTFGDRSIDTSYDVALQLNRREELFDRAEEEKDRLDAIAPGARDEIEKEKRGKLQPESRGLWDEYRQALDKYKRQNKHSVGKTAKPLLQPSLDVDLRDRAEAKPDEIARRAPQAHRHEAMDLAKQIARDEELALYTNRERMKVNFDFWRTRARAEQTPECVAARQAVYDGDRAFAKGDMIRARPKYEEGLRGWRKVLDDPEFHSLVDDVSLGGDLVDVVRRYQLCLDQDDRDLPDPFILQDIVDKHGSRQGSPLPPVTRKKAKAPPSAEKKSEKKAAPAPGGKSQQR